MKKIILGVCWIAMGAHISSFCPFVAWLCYVVGLAFIHKRNGKEEEEKS